MDQLTNLRERIELAKLKRKLKYPLERDEHGMFINLENYNKCIEIDSPSGAKSILEASEEVISNVIFTKNALLNSGPDWHNKISKKTFNNVSFASIKLEGLHFSKCLFKSCKFPFSEIKNCEFHECSFEYCYMPSVKISGTYVDPNSFKEATPEKLRYSNIGVHLFQVLMKNSRDEVQPTREADARFLFKKWERYVFQEKNRSGRYTREEKKKLNFKRKIAINWIGEVFFGHGVRLRVYLRTASFLIISLSLINFFSRDWFCLKNNENLLETFWEALYFTVISLTTVGYGDFTPCNDIGKIFMSIQSVIGFSMFGVLISMIYRKIAP